MNDRKPPVARAEQQVTDFLKQVEKHPSPSHTGGGRLIFALDATASRQPTWDTACQLQADMFTQTRGLGQLQIKLCFYRGYDELRSSPWHQGADRLVKAMSAVTCLGGHTQIGRLLDHALEQHRQQPVQALVFIGDCIEESIDELCQRAGECGLRQLPLFLFQEGHNTTASNGFAQMARLSGGAHCRFDPNSPEQLSKLLNAVAVYATAGQQALKQLSPSSALTQLRHQLEHPRR
ncbi:VWA domain-containing protein [Motiliproteus coralliicola]|uniref:VWA domain-containing protein n=1 Tax=Motiliproteus coralliicola TaxID=2283196 RepID=A0A369WVG9_9GAMM|nr:VWA domain-containing protein [Motiliproteus coralliicola]RDE24536.1 VWA domain-containing protein [Motiliproteus coralliicola]